MTYWKPKVDTTTGAAVTIDYPHAEIHSEDGYLLTYTAVVGDGSDIELRFATPNTAKWSHFGISVTGTGETDVDIYETTSLAHVGGNALTPMNRDRNSSDTSGMTFCHTPSGSGDGTLLPISSIFGVDTGSGNKRQLAGGETGSRAEIKLKQNTAYLLRVASGTAGNRITVGFDWYEHTDA